MQPENLFEHVCVFVVCGKTELYALTDFADSLLNPYRDYANVLLFTLISIVCFVSFQLVSSTDQNLDDRGPQAGP